MNSQAKRILLISYYFAPHNRIGAVRPTKLAKYLTRMGHEVTVICGTGFDGKEDPTLRHDLEQLKDVHIIREWSPLRNMLMRRSSAAPAAVAKPDAAPQTAHSQSTLKKWIKRGVDLAYRYLRWMAEENFKHKAIRELKQIPNDYDAIFSCYGPVCVHQIGRAAKKQGKAPLWIADFRDEFAFPFKWQRWRTAGFKRMLRRETDILCGVSQGILDVMGFTQHTRVLHNGFDREDLPQEHAVEKDSCLRIVYCGQLNMGRKGVANRDFTPFFRAMRALVDEGVIAENEIRVVYAGGEGKLMRSYAAQSSLEDCVEDHGWVSREESIRLQRSSDLLLLASWNTAALKGVLTGKLFEYLMMDKPIVCCVGGELPNSGVKQILTQTGVGFCCEEAAGKADEQALKEYLRTMIVRWRNGEELLVDQHQQEVDAYAYPQLAEKLAGWI